VAQRLPGVLKIVRDGNYVGVVAAREWQAVVAMRALASAARWQDKPTLPAADDLAAFVRGLPANDRLDLGSEAPPVIADAIEATYTRPFQMHASIGPSCAVALWKDDGVTVWSHTQGVYPLRDALAELVGVPKERVRCIHTEGSGCYGHNGADDVAADAALLARALPGRPVRVSKIWLTRQKQILYK
jgi:CO/xanthine dehydrogenase Mo-binding subunit